MTTQIDRRPISDAAMLRAALARLSVVSDATWAAIQPSIRSKSVAAGEQLLDAGEIARRVYFVSQGLFREYYVDHHGREATRRFCTAGEMTGSLADLLSGGPSMCSIEAIHDGEVLHLPWQEIDALGSVNSEWNMLMRRLAEVLFLRKVKREFEMLTLSASERHRLFESEYPEVRHRIPRRLVASYLGITPVHLSRVSVSETSKRAAAGQKRKT